MADKKLTDVNTVSALQDTDRIFVNATNSVRQITLTNIVNVIKTKIGSLKNPNKIKFTGAVTSEYDGSSEVTINIPVQSSAPDLSEYAKTVDVVAKNQGTSSAGKILSVGTDGIVGVQSLSDAITGETYLMTESGSVAFLATPEALEQPLTATAKHDIRAGTVAITAEGLVVGEKNFPSYETTESKVIIMPQKDVEITLIEDDKYDYTKLQAIICAFNTSMTNSVNAEKVAIDDGLYQTGSDDKISNIIKEHESKKIKFGITNTGETPLVVRYFTYKEVI